MVRMLQHEIRLRMLDAYSGCWVIRTDGLHQAAMTFGDALFDENTQPTTKTAFLKQIVVWMIRVGAMADVLYMSEPRDDIVSIPIPGDVRAPISDYIVGLGMSPDAPSWNFTESLDRRIRATFTTAAEDRATDRLTLRERIESVLLRSDEFSAAWSAAEKAIRGRSGMTLVQLDSPNIFDLAQVASFKGIASALVAVKSAAGTSQLVAKASVPAEMHSYIGADHPDRIAGSNSVLLFWRYSELLALAARRVQAFADRNRISLEADARLEDVSEAKHINRAAVERVLRSLFPPVSVNNSGRSVRTMPYIMRHTLKTPRELLFLLNSVMTVADASDYSWSELASSGPDADLEARALVRWGVHANLGELVDRMIHIPRLVDNTFILLMQATFSGNRILFSIRDIEDRLKGTFRAFRSKMRRSNLSTPEDRVKALVASGLLGVYERIGRIDDKSHVLLARFVYQLSDPNWTPRGDELVVAHPILYERYSMVAHRDMIAFPHPDEPSERDYLRRIGLEDI
jgi:hypothetical protein